MATARAIRTTSLAAPAVLAVLLAGPAKAGPAPPPVPWQLDVFCISVDTRLLVGAHFHLLTWS